MHIDGGARSSIPANQVDNPRPGRLILPARMEADEMLGPQEVIWMAGLREDHPAACLADHQAVVADSAEIPKQILDEQGLVRQIYNDLVVQDFGDEKTDEPCDPLVPDLPDERGP